MKSNKDTITQGVRITSLFGTYLPPKRKQVAKRYLTISFIILGTIPSKKNTLHAATNLPLLKGRALAKSSVSECVEWLYSSVRAFIKNSHKYEEWIEATKPTILSQAAVWETKFSDKGLRLPLDNVTVNVYHYWNDKMERDLDNKFSAIQDLLVAANIIANDDWQHLRKIQAEGENYYEQIVQPITRVDVTQAFFD